MGRASMLPAVWLSVPALACVTLKGRQWDDGVWRHTLEAIEKR